MKKKTLTRLIRKFAKLPLVHADYLVTLDTKLVENEKLESELNIKIKHPKDLS